MRKYKIYKEINNLFKQENDQAVKNFWQRCRENNITGFAWLMILMPFIIVYGVYFGIIYGPELVEKIKTKKALKQDLDSCIPEEEIDWGEDDFAE